MTQPQTDYLSTAGPYNYEQPLPPVARTNAVTQVPPAKKITFYKSGDPQFGGVKMAINQRSFKSVNALMDDLSHRVPLPFGVRTITTPRGIHCINNLDQLEDGGCYLCSDKKYVTPINFGAPSRRAGPPRNSRPTSALRRAAQEAKREDYAATLTQQSPRIPKKITLVKNGDISTRRPIILNRRNARSFKTLLDEISEIMQFTVKKLYTVDGKRIDSMQALLHCPAVLVCVGREPFKPILTESSRKPSSEKLPGLASRSNSNNVGENSEMNFGLKAKKSVIHPRSSLSNRSTRFSLSSEKSFPNGLTTSPENGAASSNNCAHSKAGDLAHTLVNDDIEKKVHVNKDGSLSVEMKVRFRLLNDETLQWSTHIQKSSLLNQTPGEELGIGENTGLDPTEKMNPEASSEAESLYPCDADSYISKLDESEIEEPHCHNCGRQRKAYDIWKNPMHTSQKEESGIRNTWYTHSSCSSTSSQRRIVRKKITSFTDSIRTSSSGEEYSERIVRESSSYSETVKNRSGGRAAKKCCCQSDCARPNTRQMGSPEEPEAAACLASSQNEDEDEDAGEASMVTGEDGEGKGSRAGSGRSKASQCSMDSQAKVCEESSTAARSLSSCSIKKTEDLEDATGCVSTPNSICSKSSKCSIPRAKDDQEEISENDQVIPSFSSEHCPKKEGPENECGKIEEGIDETNSISETMASKQSVKEEVSECDRCSSGKSFHPQTHESMRSDSDEVQICSMASSSSRISKKSKHGEDHPEADSKVSSKESSATTKKKKTKSSLHAEDVRSNSTASYCSRSSHELERTATEGHGSRDLNPHLSEVAPLPAINDESTSKISRHYSKSSRGSKKESQPEAASSLHSSFSESNEKNRDGTAKISSQLPSSRPESGSESACSKCGHVAVSRNKTHRSVDSRISSHSSTRTKCTEAEKSEDACSQSSVAQSSKPRRKKMSSLQAEAENSSQASLSESASVYSLHCPVPPQGRPSNRKRRTVLLKKSSNSASLCTELEPTTDEERKEIRDSSRLVSSVSKSLEMDTANAEGNTSDALKEETGTCQEKDPGEETEAAADRGDEMIPSSLPNATPEEVVHEWLRNIPSETLLMKYEMDDDGEEGTGLSAEIPNDSNHPEGLEEDKKKDDTEELEDMPATEAVEEGVEEQAEEVIEDHSEKASEAMPEKGEAGQAECGHSVVFTQNNPQRDLPSTIQTSVKIMKALLASKQEAKLDRSHSMPEVSPTMGRKLGNSAKILITCLTSLQLLDEELDPPDNSKPSSKSRYMELLNIFQTLWFGCASESSGPSTEQQGEEQEKVASGIKAHPTRHGNFTATSSSGVDVGSVDGVSREGSVAGVQDRALSPEEIEEAEHIEEEATEEQCEEIHSRSEEILEEKEAGDGEGEQEGPSRPPTACSKSERGEKAESNRAEEGAEADDNQGGECEMGQDEEKEEAKKGNSSINENEECAETDVEAHPTQEGLEEKPERGNSPNEEEADRATEQPGNGETESDPHASEAKSERVKESNAEKQSVDEPPADEEPSNRVVHQATVTTSSPIQERSMEPDPVWVLKLLKKIEKEFMTHYVSAMNDFKLKWNLQNNEELDVMIAELKEEVSKRIQKSIEKELRKIQSRAGKRVPRPPNSELRRESTLQAGSRRRRLQSTHRTSLLDGSQSKQPESRTLSCDQDEKDFFFSTTIKDDVSDLLSDDEYCPCDACLRKKMSSKSTVNTVVVMSNAPVVKAFDLQKILQTKKDDTEKREPDDIIEEIQDEKEVPIEPAEEEPEEHKENPATELSEERNADETNEQGEEEVNEDGTEVIADEVEAEGEEASNEDRENETKTEGEEKAQQEEEEVKEDGAEEEVEEDKVEEEEQREEGDVKEKEEEEEEKEMNEKGQEEDVKEEDEEKEEEKEEGEEEGEDVKEEGEGKEEEEREEIKEEEGVKQEEEMKEEEMKDDKEEENVEDKGEEEEGELEEQKEEENTKEEEEQKEGEEEMGVEENEEEVMKDDQEEGENMKDEEIDAEEGEVEEQDEKEDAKEEEEQKEGDEAMGEEEKGEDDMKEEEEKEEEEEQDEMEEEEEKKQQEENMGKEYDEKEEEEVEEEEKREGDMNEEDAEKEEEKEEDEENNLKEVVDEIKEEEEEEEEEEGKHVKEEVDEMQEEEVEAEEEKEEEEEKEVEEAHDEKEEDVIEEDENKEEEEAEVVMEEEDEMKEECKDEEEEMKDEKVEEEVDMIDEVEEKEKAEEEKVEENDEKEDEEIEEEEEAKEKEMEEEDIKEEVAPEEDAQEAGSEGEEETNDEKEMDKEKEETYMEAEEEPKLENETDGTVEEPQAAETVQVSGEEGEQGDNDTEDETEVIGRQEAEEEASPETGCDACSETAEIEADSDDAGKEEEEAGGEKSCEPVQNNEDELPNKAEDEEINDGLEPSRSASAFSYSSSVGNCSQQSQKGSEDGIDGDDCIEEENVSTNNSVDEDAQTDTKSKPGKMYPESVEEEEEEEEDCASSQESPVKGGEAKTTRKKKDGDQVSSIKQGNSNEAIDPGDLDF